MKRVVSYFLTVLVAASLCIADEGPDVNAVYTRARIGFALPDDFQPDVEDEVWYAFSSSSTIMVVVSQARDLHTVSDLSETSLPDILRGYGVQDAEYFTQIESDCGLLHYAFVMGKLVDDFGGLWEGFMGLVVNRWTVGESWVFAVLVPSLADEGYGNALGIVYSLQPVPGEE